MPKSKLEKALNKKFKAQEVQTEKMSKLMSEQKAAHQKQVDKLKLALKKQGESMKEFMEQGGKSIQKDFDNQFEEFIDKKKKEIGNIFKTGKGVVIFKAVGDITTGSENVVETPNLSSDTKLTAFNLENYNFLKSLVTTFNTNKAGFSYSELKPKEGDFAVVAEGEEKPQIDFSWETRYAEPQKSAAYEILTEEVIKDVPRMKSLAKKYLRKKHDIHKAKQIIAYAISISRTFNAGAMANAIDVPVFMDVVNAMAVDVATTYAYEDEKTFLPNLVIINPVDFFINFAAAKDDTGKPLYPTATLFNRVSVGGMLIIPSRLMVTGKVFVADMSNINMTNYVPYHVRIGWINDQFIHNKFTILGESRYHLFTKEQDKNSFIYDDFAVVKAAITKP